MNVEHISKAIETNVRYDGRKRDEYRKITIEYDVSATAEGSAMVTCGDSQVIAGIKMGLATPYDDVPDQGMLMVDVGLLPLSSPKFEAGPPGIDSIELARVTDRGIRESHAIDMKQLCVKEGEKVWSVSIDICTINADGNMFDLASLAAIAAIKNAKFPELDANGKVDYKKKSKKSLPLQHTPISVTVWKLKDKLVVDPTSVEEDLFESRLTINFIEDGQICAMQKGGEGTLTKEDVLEMTKLAKKKSEELRKHL